MAQAVLAAQTVGLDIAGLDVLAEDISKPLFEQRGAVVEVNAGPSLTPHVVPLFGKPRPVGEAVVNMLFPNNRPHSIPICGIVTYNEDDACLAEVNRWLTEEKSRNRTAGVVHLNAIRIGELRIELPEYDANSRARAMIGHPSVESILIVLTPRDLIEHGQIGRAHV